MEDCNKVLMVYGLSNLAKMGDESLDKMDPYQRGAMDINCNKVLMVYGLSNLAKMGDESLDKMDPYQRGAMDISEYS
ncbi:hypothetical protein J6590_041016 [Homalodisca vitripennis]|nr:hypothetical protein J6590_041016 [Homalodisca vitripennis]